MSIKAKIYTLFRSTDRKFIGNKREIAKHFEINYTAFKTLLNLGYTKKEAIDIHLEKIRSTNLTYKNQKGDTRELRRMFNKNYIEVYNNLSIITF